MAYSPPEFKQHKRLFSKKMLWTMNLLLILLIWLLAKSAKEPAVSVNIPPTTDYELSTLQIQQLSWQQFTVMWVPLANAQQLQMSFILQHQPTLALDLPEAVRMQVDKRYGQLIVSFQAPMQQQTVFELIEFLRLWLPSAQVNWQMVVLGELDASMLRSILSNLQQVNGESIPYYAQSASYLFRLPALQLNDPRYLDYYLALRILQNRVVNNRTQFEWDLASKQAYIKINSGLEAHWVQPASEQEFDFEINRIKQVLQQPQHSINEISSYLQLQALYNLPLDYFQSRKERLQHVTLAKVSHRVQIYMI